MGYVLQVSVFKAIKSFCFKIPRFFYSAEQRKSLCSRGK